MCLRRSRPSTFYYSLKLSLVFCFFKTVFFAPLKEIFLFVHFYPNVSQILKLVPYGLQCFIEACADAITAWLRRRRSACESTSCI